MRNNFKISLIIVFSFFAFGCGPKGPLVEVCIVDVPKLGADCALANKTSAFKDFSQIDAYVCTSAVDYGRLLDAAKTASSMPLIEVCISHPSAKGSDCVLSDRTTRFKTYEEMDAYVCTNPNDYSKLVKAAKEKIHSKTAPLVVYGRGR